LNNYPTKKISEGLWEGRGGEGIGSVGLEIKQSTLLHQRIFLSVLLIFIIIETELMIYADFKTSRLLPNKQLS
jgi:hypothetical protein